MNTVLAKQTIAEQIRTIEGSGLDVAQKVRALTALFFNRNPEGKNVGRIMLAIEMHATQLALRIGEPELGFEKMWEGSGMSFPSTDIHGLVKSAMKIGYVAGKLNVTQ